MSRSGPGTATSIAEPPGWCASVDAHDSRLNCWYSTDKGGSTPKSATLLHVAASTGNAAIIRLLARHGLSVLATDEFGQGPLHAACLGIGKREAVEILLELGANPNQADKDGVVPLGLASEERTVAALLAAGADPDPAGAEPRPLEKAIRYGEVGMARLLIEAGAEPDQDLLAYAAYCSQAESMRLLLEYGLPADGREGAPLHRCLQRGHVEGVEILVAAGARVAEDALGHVSWSWGEKAIRCAELLVSAGADPKRCQAGTSSPLHSAALIGKVAAIDFLLSQGAEADARDSLGHTPLMVACREGEKEAVERLLKAGADPVVKAPDGRTPWSVTKVSNRDIKNLLERYIPKKSPGPAAPASPPEWKEGDSVRHVKFGEGVIVETNGSGDQLKATVDFESHGAKQLLARFLARP